MKRSALPAMLLLFLCVGFLLFLSWSSQQLPQQVATRFGFNGRPVAWMSRGSAIGVFGAFGIGLPLFLVLVSFALPLVPDRSVSMPNREYWLAPERRDLTYAYVSRQMLWLACIMVCFMTALTWLTVQANSSTPVQMPTQMFLTTFGVYLAAMAVWMLCFVRRFRRPKQL
jgi:hypothetical protein